jgi:hypothetical protein
MNLPREPEPQLLVVALFSRHEQALAWGRERLEQLYGPVAMASDIYPFAYTAYYERAMGTQLQKQLLAFQQLVPADQLATVKRQTIRLEEELAGSGLYPEPRPLNLDPGHLNVRKLLLATTKDQIHRVYLREGIYAEVTLIFHEGAFRALPWTYADYQQPLILDFLHEARKYYLERRKAPGLRLGCLGETT